MQTGLDRRDLHQGKCFTTYEHPAYGTEVEIWCNEVDFEQNEGPAKTVESEVNQ